ncbi:Ammonium transporter [Parasponia andersonii]|uniref:Ammonium transporter n=1 Tax=Parasponia andersonii TaxID=3476 RepID=A0A2P5B178_PARAD|nr:Ammonium transporter [Parasponia andersonii]
MSFGHKLLPFWGKAGLAVSQDFLIPQAILPSTQYKNITAAIQPFYPTASMVFFQYAFAAVTAMLLAGSVLARMSIRARMVFVPLWITFSYSVGAYSIWGGGFLFQWGIMDYSGVYVFHLASGAAGFTAAYWMGWTGFNGGDPFAANVDSSLAVLNTHICAATTLLVWICWDVITFKKPPVIGAIHGMITGLVCITPGAGLVQAWSAILMGIISGTVPWYTMMCLSKQLPLLRKVDDTLGVLQTHAVAGILGGTLTGQFAHPDLSNMLMAVPNSKGAIYGGPGGVQFLKRLVGADFIIGCNVLVTSIILQLIKVKIPLRTTEEELIIGDDAAHGEEAYALAGQGRREKSIPNDINQYGFQGAEP